MSRSTALNLVWGLVAVLFFSCLGGGLFYNASMSRMNDQVSIAATQAYLEGFESVGRASEPQIQFTPTPPVVQDQSFNAVPSATPVGVAVTPSIEEPIAQAGHGELFANWDNPMTYSSISAVTWDRWVVVSSDPATFTLQDANGFNVWQYTTPSGCTSNCGALWFLRIPANHTLITQVHNWQQGSDHWAISGWSYTSLEDAALKWQLMHYSAYRETKPTYVTNVDGDLKSPQASTERPVRTIP